MAIATYMMGFAAVAGAISAAVAMLPGSRRVERTGFVSAPPETVFALIESTEGFQRFNPYRDDEPNLKITPIGPAAGIGAGFAFEGKSASGTQTIVALERNRSVTMQIDLGSMGKPVQSISLKPENGGTRITWATESQFGANPIQRVFGMFLDRMLGPTYERGIDNLAKASIAVH
jgi:carbon monoxide dehydrogenase subunit G